MKFRILFAVLGAIGMAIIYGFKVNLSVAIVAMVNQTAIKELSDSHLIADSNLTDALTCSSGKSDENTQDGSEDGPLIWTEPQQGKKVYLKCTINVQ